MNDKTRAQIEAMKKQTIGVEIEMNNITREKEHGTLHLRNHLYTAGWTAR